MSRGFRKMFKQDVTYWQPNAIDKHGNTSWRRGKQVKGRWQDKVEQVQNSQGEEVMSKSIVYMFGGLVIEEDYRFALGCISDTDPDTLAKAYRVIAVGDSPSLNDTRSLKKIWLA